MTIIAAPPTPTPTPIATVFVPPLGAAVGLEDAVLLAVEEMEELVVEEAEELTVDDTEGVELVVVEDVDELLFALDVTSGVIVVIITPAGRVKTSLLSEQSQGSTPQQQNLFGPHVDTPLPFALIFNY